MLRFAYADAAMDRDIKQIEEEVKNIRINTQLVPDNTATNEYMLLSPSSGAIIAAHLQIPEIQMEIDRAVWQVERAIKAQKDQKEVDKTTTLKEKAEQ